MAIVKEGQLWVTVVRPPEIEERRRRRVLELPRLSDNELRRQGEREERERRPAVESTLKIGQERREEDAKQVGVVKRKIETTKRPQTIAEWRKQWKPKVSMALRSLLVGSAVLAPGSTGHAQPDPCWDIFAKLHDDLSNQGLATPTRGPGLQLNQPRITTEGCKSLELGYRQVTSQCSFDDYLNTAVRFAQQSDILYRRCYNQYSGTDRFFGVCGNFARNTLQHDRIALIYTDIARWRAQCD